MKFWALRERRSCGSSPFPPLQKVNHGQYAVESHKPFCLQSSRSQCHFRLQQIQLSVLLMANHRTCDCSTEHCPITSQNALFFFFFFPTCLYIRTYLAPSLGTCTLLDQPLWLHCPHKVRWQNVLFQLRGLVPCWDEAGGTAEVKNSFCTDLSPLPCLYPLAQ